MKAQTIITLLISILLSACATPVRQSSYLNNYMQALDQYPGDKVNSNQLAADFESFFTHMKTNDLSVEVERLYADTLYFNDTFLTFTTRSELIPYMQKTANQLQSITLDVQDISQSGQNYYLRWVMDMTFTASGDTITTHSIGVTHLRLNGEGKIILHQDFWDSTDGFFKHLPYVGYLIGIVQKRL